MAESFFGGSFFDGEFFNQGGKTGVGGIDPGEGLKRRYPPYKPTGILHLPKGKNREEIEERIDQAQLDRIEIAERLAREFSEEIRQTPELEELPVQKPISVMSSAEIENEIGIILRNKLKRDSQIAMLLLLIAASES
jgi:hypothetical protein